MKKLFALLLVAVMCFSLVACGGGNDTPTTSNNNEQQTNNEQQANESGSQQEAENNNTNTDKFHLYQEWKEVVTGDTLTFKDNGTVIYRDTEYKYDYDEESGLISLYMAITRNMNVVNNEIYQLVLGSSYYVPVEYYEEYHAKIANFFGTWEKDTSEIIIDNNYGVEYSYQDGDTTYHTSTSYIINDNTISFNEFEFVIDTSVSPMTLTQVGDETAVYFKVE